MIVTFLDNFDGYVGICSELEKVIIDCDNITFNGGNNGGLVNIQALVDKLNTIEDKLNNHEHAYVSSGGPAVTTPLPGDVPLVNTQVKDLEDSKIKH